MWDGSKRSSYCERIAWTDPIPTGRHGEYISVMTRKQGGNAGSEVLGNMPLQNRVCPDGAIVATPARGAWMGNRGCLHDTNQRIVRESASARWICCPLDYRGNRRRVMTPKRYTELFFLDEVTALASGHRPCGECRRQDLKRFSDAWPIGGDSLSDIDKRLRKELRQSIDPIECWNTYPSGPMFADPSSADFYLLHSGTMLRWSFAGYSTIVNRIGHLCLLTPTSIVAVFQNGYIPQIHPSVDSIMA